MRIYVASSWRNLLQQAIVHALRRIGHEVYDFRNPVPGNDGFRWTEIDPDWKYWSPGQYREALKHPIAERGYSYDIDALKACEACVLVLPAGRSASWEFGYAMGQGKKAYVIQFESQEPELMFREASIIISMSELFDAFGEPNVRGLTESQFRQRAAAGRATQHATINGVRVPVLMSQADVALLLGVSQMTVSTDERSALEKLTRALR
jgi:DNA-binding transcriptional regulator YiaG